MLNENTITGIVFYNCFASVRTDELDVFANKMQSSGHSYHAVGINGIA